MYMGEADIKAYAWSASYNSKRKAETPVFLKDTVSYKTGKWKYLKLFLFFIHYSVN